MKIEELRDLSDDELLGKRKELKKERFQMRFKKVTGDVGNPSLFKKIQQDIARINTIQREREIYEQWKTGKESKAGEE